MSKQKRIEELREQIDARWEDMFDYQVKANKARDDVKIYESWAAKASSEIDEMESLLADLEE